MIFVCSPGEVPEVTSTLQRTSASEMFVLWESGGWRLEPQVSVLDVRGNTLPAQTESTLGPDGLFSVRAKMDAEAAAGDRNRESAEPKSAQFGFNATCVFVVTGTGPVICRVEIPGTSMVQERLASVTGNKNIQNQKLLRERAGADLMLLTVDLKREQRVFCFLN